LTITTTHVTDTKDKIVVWICRLWKLLSQQSNQFCFFLYSFRVCLDWW